MFCIQVLNKVITVYAALCSEVKKLKYEVSIVQLTLIIFVLSDTCLKSKLFLF